MLGESCNEVSDPVRRRDRYLPVGEVVVSALRRKVAGIWCDRHDCRDWVEMSSVVDCTPVIYISLPFTTLIEEVSFSVFESSVLSLLVAGSYISHLTGLENLYNM